MIGIQFWLKVPWKNEPGQPTCANEVAKKLGVTAFQLQSAFEKWRQEEYTRDFSYPIPDQSPEVLNIWFVPESENGFVRRARSWGKGTRRTGDQMPFTMEVVL
jgi:hypothetical protein